MVVPPNTCRSVSTAPSRETSRKRGASKEVEGSEKLSALMLAIKQIEHNHGKGSLMRFGDKGCHFPKMEVISTGSMALDHALGKRGVVIVVIILIYHM